MTRETRTREERYDVYIADDGTVFTDKDKCKEYESTIECLYITRFQAISKKLVGKPYYAIDTLFDDDRAEMDYYLVTPKDETDVMTICGFVKYSYSFDKDTAEKVRVGNTYIVAVGECWSKLQTTDEFINDYENRVEAAKKAFDGTLEEEPKEN